MKNLELDALLKRARTPEPPEEFWEEFPRSVVRRLNRGPTRNWQSRREWSPRLAAWGLAAAICIIIGFAAGHWRGPMQSKIVPLNDVLADAKLIREALEMFPNQVRAIVQDERGLHLILSDRDNIPASAPLYVHVCDGQRCTSVVTFSGQEIQVAGQKVTVLTDARDGIILTGNQFVWSNTERTFAGDHLKIEARNLGLTAM